MGYGGEGGGADNRHRPKKFWLFDPTRIYKHKVKLSAFICYVESDIHFFWRRLDLCRLISFIEAASINPCSDE